MANPFSDKKTCKVLAVDASGPVRQMMADTLRSALGFEMAEGRSTILEAMQHLETEKVDWIIIPLSADQPANGMHLLKVCSEHPQLKKTRISIFLDQEEQYVIPLAFSLGLLSWHSKPFTKDTYGEELKTLFLRMEQDQYKDQLTAAHYFRLYLSSKSLFSMQLALEKGLLEIFPGDPDILINMAEPLHKLGKTDAAKTTLLQARLLDEKKADDVSGAAKKLFGEPLPALTEMPAGENVLGLGTCLIIDSDDSVRSIAKDIFTKLGVTDIADFAGGEEAWAYISKAEKEPSLILMEWKIPGITGPLLLQRIRQHGFCNVPIIVMSSLIQADDMPLVKEIGISNIVRKPIRREDFLPTLVWTIQQERMPTEHQTMERKVRSAIKANKKDIYEPILQRFLADPTVLPGKKKLVEAELAYQRADYLGARNLSIDSIKLSGDSILALNVLGKSFMRLKDYVSAQKCFEKAQKLSPVNIERLCNLAEVKTELGDNSGATKDLEKAKTLDPDAQIVKEAEVRVALATGDTKSAKDLMKSIDALDGLISYMNNKAVSYAKVGFPKDAIEIYKKTAESIPDDQVDLVAIVNYNRALAVIKAGDLEAANTILGEIEKLPNNKVSKKSKSLSDRLTLSLKRGTEFKLKADEPTSKPPNGGHGGPENSQEATLEEQNLGLLGSVSIERGDLCCYLLFNNPEKYDIRAESMLAKPPRFQFRATIEKVGLMGGEKQESKESA